MTRRVESLIVLRAQSGERVAMDRLLSSVQSPLFRCVRHIVGSRELAEDVLQDVFVILYSKLRLLREPDFFRSWAYRIAVREALRAVRKEKRFRPIHDEEILDAIPEGVAEEEGFAELRDRLPELVERVTPASRAVLVLHYLEGLPLLEVAGVLELPLGTVKSRLAYGLGLMRQSLRERGGEGGPDPTARCAT